MIEKFIKNKKLLIPFLGALLAIAMLIPSWGSNEDTTAYNKDYHPEYDSDELKTYTERMEEKIEAFLEEINGITEVSVILTVESSSETVYATQGANSDYVLVKDAKGNENAIPLTEISAKIRGIAVVCDYGGNERLKMTVIDLLSALFDLGANRISVLSA